ncbi:MAG: CvpA family protein, partial [Candidatus Omnitrophica bacterium]|nr:CvpA family protein [Candidatus Omnitrophota bacterium]
MEISLSQTFIDLVFLILCLRVVYISISRGIIHECFKLAGLLLGSFFAFHYYSSLADKISDKIPFLGREYFLLFSFLLILLGVRLIFTLSRLIVTFFFKKDEVYFKEMVMLFFLGSFRASLIGSIIFISLYLSPLDAKNFCHSISYSISKNVGPKIYLVAFKVYDKFSPKIVVNKGVEEYYEAEKSLPGNSK